MGGAGRRGHPARLLGVNTDHRMAFEHLSDQGLIALCARGDHDALGILYDRYGRAAYSLARRIVRDPSLAEDIVQEAFLAVWRQAARFDARRARPSTWLLALVHHKAVDVVRREDLRRADDVDEQRDAASDADVPHDAWLSLQREHVAAALAALPDPQREVIELAYYAGFSQSELADRLDQPLGTIKSRTHAALARLRQLLEERGVTTENPWSTKSSRT
jgi:RNA polymerase sigma-70 factor (ECF subfamily)